MSARKSFAITISFCTKCKENMVITRDGWTCPTSPTCDDGAAHECRDR